MLRRSFTLLWMISLTLFVGVFVLYARGRPSARGSWGDTFILIDPFRGRWQLTSWQGLRFGRTGDYPAARQLSLVRMEPTKPRDYSVAQFIDSPAGTRGVGAHLKFDTWNGRFISHGSVCILMRTSREVWLGPPFPADPSKTIYSLPKPYWSVGVAYGDVLLFLAILPVIQLFRSAGYVVRRKIRHKNNRCRMCGYDLRATPDRCPECGTAANSKPVPNGNPVISN